MEKAYYKTLTKLLKEASSPQTSHERLIEIATQVAKTNDPYLICDFCEFCDRADDAGVMPILQQAIEQNNNPLHVYEFAYLMADCERECVDYNSLLQRIVSFGDPKLICYCREFVPVFSQQRLDLAMAKVGNKRWLEHYGEVTDFLTAHSYEAKVLQQRYALVQKLASEGKSVVPEAIKTRAAFTSKNGLVDAYNYALSSRDPYFLTNLLENFPRIDKSGRLAERLAGLGDVMSVYEYGASCESANIGLVERCAIESDMPKYMYYVGAYCPGADIDKLLSAVKASSAPDFVKQKYIKKIEDHIKESGEPGDD